MSRRLAHSYRDEVRRPYRQAVPAHESQRRVAVETLTDIVALAAIVVGAIVFLLSMGAILRFAVTHPLISGIYIGVVGAFIVGLCRMAAKGDRP